MAIHESTALGPTWYAGAEAAKRNLLPELIMLRCRRAPTAPAIRFGGITTTYGQIDGWSEATAQSLRAAGVVPGDLVAVAVRRGPALVAALLGVLKAGAAFVPIDMGHPKQRVIRIVEHAAPSAVLASAGSCEARATGRFDGRAYVAYTSGSTSEPKGVICTHEGVMYYLSAMIDAFALDEGDRVLAMTSIAFDPSVRDVFGTLLAGATIVMASSEEAYDPPSLAALLERERVTSCLSIVPWAMKLLVEELEARPRQLSLRQLISCGDVLSGSLAGRARSAFDCAIINQYGPTECTMVATFHRVEEADLARPCVPIGREIGGAVVRVLNEQREQVPVGTVGQLAIGGDGLASGYLGQPELTYERFVPDPWNEGGRLYLTDDLGRRRADGLLEFVGRIDDQIRGRGSGFDLGRVAESLRMHPEIAEAVAAALPDEAGERQPVAFVVPVAVLHEENLQAWAQNALPELTVPLQLLALERMPLTPNGKVDRRALWESYMGRRRRLRERELRTRPEANVGAGIPPG